MSSMSGEVKVLKEWCDGEIAEIIVSLPDGRKVIFTAELHDCHCRDSYIRAKLVENGGEVEKIHSSS